MTRSTFFIIIIFISTFKHLLRGEETIADVWIQNGAVIDGLGGPAVKVDILIMDDEIYYVGKLPEDVIAADTIDACGLVVTPGFIDPHAHGNPFDTPEFNNFTSMGVTTIALGQDGSSANTSDLIKLIEDTDKLKLGPNIALFVGHGTIRNLSGINYKRNPSNDEIQKMSDLLEEGMKAGAFGLSTGLEYTPGRYAKQFELHELAKVVGKYDGLIMSHIRTENDATMESDLAELFSHGDFANIHVSHMKVVYGKGSERAEKILQLLDQKRSQSTFNVSADVYPYLASYTTIAILFPEYALAPNHYGTVQNNRRDDLLKYVREKVNQRNGPEATLFGTVPYKGKTLKQVADEMSLPFEEVLVDRFGPMGGLSAAYFTMDRDLQYRFIQDPHVMISSDGSPTMYHPRGYGSFAKVIEQFVLKDSLLTLEEAIRKMSSLPARMIGIKDRGILRPGFKADILIFNPDSVQANATYDSPHQLATGFDYIFVNGKLQSGFGQVLRKN
ncbi:MAG: amidohydrolase family protein [Candidatus Marinimicrobia bacterium]|nr:amidohydrolase family protein [Candidatus Neomarinimicrobiota bacterium]